MEYTSLGKLVGQQFTIQKVNGYSWKMWSNADNRMISSDTYKEGFSKKYQVDTDKGKLDLGTGQLGNLLEAVFKDGHADLNGKTFEVKSNGKQGKDIRYFFNVVKDFQPEPSEATRKLQRMVDDSAEDEVKLDDDLEGIPF